MFKLLRNFHLSAHRLFLHASLSLRLLALMRVNRMLLQAFLREVSASAGADQHATLVMNGKIASMAADAMEQSLETTWLLRQSFISSPLARAVVSLWSTRYDETNMLAATAHVLYEQAGPDLRGLNPLRFDPAIDHAT